MPNQEEEIQELVHKAQHIIAPVPVELVEKPDELDIFTLHSPEDKEAVFALMRQHNVERILGASVLELQKKVNVDELTGTGSKESGKKRMQEIIDAGNKLEIFYLDFNNFSDINNRLGHTIGDTMLIELTASLMGSLREGESIHRFGGDEFVIVKDSDVISDRRKNEFTVSSDQRQIPDRRKTDVEIDAVGLRKRFSDAYDSGISKLKEILGNDLESKMGVSIGHAVRKNNQTVDQLIKEADARMYKDKKNKQQGSDTLDITEAEPSEPE